MKLNQTLTHILCILVLLFIYRSLRNKRKLLSASNVASSTQIVINQRGCLHIWLTALKVLTSLITCSIFTLLFASARLNFRARLLSLWLSKCICPARIGVNKEPWSGYALSANSDAFGGMSKNWVLVRWAPLVCRTWHRACCPRNRPEQIECFRHYL